jgi:hypothetical protein
MALTVRQCRSRCTLCIMAFTCSFGKESECVPCHLQVRLNRLLCSGNVALNGRLGDPSLQVKAETTQTCNETVRCLAQGSRKHSTFVSYSIERPPLFSWTASVVNWSEFLAKERRCIVSCEVWTDFIYVMQKKVDRLCGLVVRVPGYRTEMYCFLWGTNWIYICYVEESRPPLWLQIQRSGFDSRSYQIFWEVVGLERGILSLVSTIEELLGRKNSGTGLESRDYDLKEPSRWPRGTPYPQTLAITSLTSGGTSVGPAACERLILND